jgi:hypothetical protein
MHRLSSPIDIFRCIPQSLFPFSSNVADRTDDCSAYLTDTFRQVISHQEELLSVLVEQEMLIQSSSLCHCDQTLIYQLSANLIVEEPTLFPEIGDVTLRPVRVCGF